MNEIRIHPTSTGTVFNRTNEWSMSIDEHIQGIAQAGEEYVILSSSKNEKGLILAHYGGGDKEVVNYEYIPKEYNHAGGIDVLETEGGWRIIVPVFEAESSDDDNSNSAILHYFLNKQDKYHDLTLRRITKLKDIKACAAGVTEIKDNGERKVLISVVNDTGKVVKFLECQNPDKEGEGKYDSTDEWINADEEDWRGYSNSISLINYKEAVYFIGMHNEQTRVERMTSRNLGYGKDLIDIFKISKNTNWKREKVAEFHATCNAPSFRWGGSAQVIKDKIEILAVERDIQQNNNDNNRSYVRYDKFGIKISTENGEKKFKSEIEVD